MYMVDDVYIVNYSDIINLINEGYYVLSDLRIALERKLINNKHNNVILYIDHENKYIDVYANVFVRRSFEFGRWRTVGYFDDRKKVFYEST